MASNLDEMLELSTCSVCPNEYDREERTPKFLGCHHTFCAKCIAAMTLKMYFNSSGNTSVSCPLCRQVTKIRTGDGIECLKTNPYALELIRSMKKMTETIMEPIAHDREHNWCLTCGLLLNPQCREKRHCSALVESGKISDAQEMQTLMDTSKTNLARAIQIRQENRTYLERTLQSVQRVEDSIKARVEANDVQLAEMVSSLQAQESPTHWPNPIGATIPEELRELAEKSEEQVRLASDYQEEYDLRVQVNVINAENQPILLNPNMTRGFYDLNLKYKNRPIVSRPSDTRNEMNLVAHLVFSIHQRGNKTDQQSGAGQNGPISSSTVYDGQTF